MQVVRDLGLVWEQRILANYLGMFASLKEKQGWAFSDVTFDNFADVHFSFERHRRLFEAGNGRT